MTEKFSIAVQPITCHAFNGNRNDVAMSLNNHEVKIFQKQAGQWKDTCTLTEHGQRVTSIDWAPKTDRIVTCGADRNAYVWIRDGKDWKPHLVILRINRAATCVRWSPLENKFAVGSGARLISICYFEEEHNWWVSKHIKKPIRSTVTSLDWHPNNILIGAGSTDFKARVFSAYVKEVEAKPSATNWGAKMPFGIMMAEFSNGGGGWVHGVSFSPTGDKLAWVGHDSSISVVDAANGQKLTVLKGNFLPFCGLTWITENSIVCVGFDCCPKVFSHQGDNIKFVNDLDIPEEKQASNVSAMRHFRDMDKRGQSGDKSTTALKTLHQNTITQVSVFGGSKEKCTKLSTSGVDGNIVLWDLNTLEQKLSGLRIA